MNPDAWKEQFFASETSGSAARLIKITTDGTRFVVLNRPMQNPLKLVLWNPLKL